MDDVEIDARRLLCPMPVIRLQDGMAKVPVGALVTIICTDPGVKNDIPAWSNINGHRVITIQEQGDDIIVTVRKESED